jgi:Protein of unknown function (DUF3072)
MFNNSPMEAPMKSTTVALAVASACTTVAFAQDRSDDRVSGNKPMTGGHASYLKTLSERCGEANAFAPDLNDAEVSKRIDALNEKRRPVKRR